MSVAIRMFGFVVPTLPGKGAAGGVPRGSPGFRQPAGFGGGEEVVLMHPTPLPSSGNSGASASYRTFWYCSASKPERARPTWSAMYVSKPLRVKYSYQPMRPSGVVSQVLELRQQPCTKTIGGSRLLRAGFWNCTYIWLIIELPGRPPAYGSATSCVLPPMKKLPYADSVRLPADGCMSSNSCATASVGSTAQARTTGPSAA